MSRPPLDLARSERVAEAQRLAATGLNGRQVADAMGVSRSYVSKLLTDPTGEKERARKRRYGKPCLDCGKTTDGSNGHAKAPDYCAACTERRRAAQHGTLSKYSSGCSCDPCREANRLHHRSLLGRTPPSHGTSGYLNYGCRCDICSDAHRDYQWLHSEYRERWVAKVRGTEPPKHGTATAYNVYGCRCETCRGWRSRRYQARKREAAA